MNSASRRPALRDLVNQFLQRLGYQIIRLRSEDRRSMGVSHDASVQLPPGAAEYLRADNPRLIELRKAYVATGWPVVGESVFWNQGEVDRNILLPWFRGDNAYVWQYRQLGADARLKRYIALREVQDHDARGLLSRLNEDGVFGCWTENYGRHGLISRDLLDSVREINFLDQHAGLFDRPGLRVLDIGAGYGRLAYRMSQVLPNLVRYDCLDAVPESTFLCEYYLRFRGVTPPARAVPLHEIDSGLAPDGYDLALNIHSFPECTYAAIEWWMARVKSLRVPWLLIVPNDAEKLLSAETDGSLKDFTPLIRDAGYELAVKAPVLETPEVRELAKLHDHFFLFRRRA